MEPVLKLGSTTVAGGKQDITEYIKNANASAFDTEQPPGEVKSQQYQVQGYVLDILHYSGQNGLTLFVLLHSVSRLCI